LGTIKTKLAEWLKNRGLVRTCAIIGGVILVLLICLCISICMQSNIHGKYSASIHGMQEQAYRNLTRMTELFARVDDPEADVRQDVLPEMKAQYTAAAAINSLLAETGRKNALLSQEQIAAFDAAFEQYDKAFRKGSATGLARADMAACMEDVQAMVQLHNDPPNEDEEDVVIINASSGKIEEKSN